MFLFRSFFTSSTNNGRQEGGLLGEGVSDDPPQVETLPSDVFQIIFSYLHNREVIRCALVSRKWYSYVMETNVQINIVFDCMKKYERWCKSAEGGGLKLISHLGAKIKFKKINPCDEIKQLIVHNNLRGLKLDNESKIKFDSNCLKRIVDLKKLTNLTLRNVNLTTGGYELIGGMKQLKHVEIVECYGCELGVQSICKLTGLTNLKLRKLKARMNTDEAFKYLPTMTNLRTLDLSNTPLGSAVSLVTNLINLEKLNLSLTFIDNISLSKLRKLRKLDISENPCITSIDLSNLIRLKSLNLSSTTITNITGMNDLIELRDLDISNNVELFNSPNFLNSISSLHLPKLISLDVSKNKLENEKLILIAKSNLPELTTLTIRGNKAGEEANPVLYQSLPRLKYINRTNPAMPLTHDRIEHMYGQCCKKLNHDHLP